MCRKWPTAWVCAQKVILYFQNKSEYIRFVLYFGICSKSLNFQCMCVGACTYIYIYIQIYVYTHICIHIKYPYTFSFYVQQNFFYPSIFVFYVRNKWRHAGSHTHKTSVVFLSMQIKTLKEKFSQKLLVLTKKNTMDQNFSGEVKSLS